jgi:hypothetical protein
MKRYLQLLLFAASLVFFVACEISYGVIDDTTASTPEFQLNGARVTHYENGRLTAQLDAGMVEQYKNNSSIFGSSVSFVIYEENGTEIGHGKCGLISADTGNEIYLLFDSIEFVNNRDQFALTAEAIKWSSKEGLLSSERNGIVSIVQNRRGGNGETSFSLSGTEFSVNRNKRTFEFNAPVTGFFESEDYADEE